MSAYSDAVLADSPAGYWRCGEASGNLADSSGNGSTATASGAPTYSVAGALSASGDTNTAVTITDNKYFVTGNQAALKFGTGDFTVEAWFRNWVTDGRILTKGAGSGVLGWRFGVEANKLSILIGDADEYVGPSAVSGAIATTTVWHHFVATFDRDGVATGYVDGYATSPTVNISAVEGTTDNTSGVSIGRYAFGGHTDVDEIAIYSGLLSATRILAHYTAAAAAAAGTVYPATGRVDSSTAASGTATVERAATGAAGGVVTGASAAAFAKHFATALVSVVTTLSGAAFRRHPATGTVAAVTGSSATPTTKRAATGSAAAATGLSGTAKAKHPTSGTAGAVTTGTSGIAAAIRLAGTAPSINVVTGLQGDATVTEAPTVNYATGHVDAVAGLSGRANVTRKATGSVSSITGLSGAGLAKYGVTGSVSSTTSVSGAARAIRVAIGRCDVVTTIWDATVYATIGLVSAGVSRGMATPGTRRGFASAGCRGITAAAALGRSLTSEGHERTTP